MSGAYALALTVDASGPATAGLPSITFGFEGSGSRERPTKSWLLLVSVEILYSPFSIGILALWNAQITRGIGYARLNLSLSAVALGPMYVNGDMTQGTSLERMYAAPRLQGGVGLSFI
jgi:hypothetical protein